MNIKETSDELKVCVTYIYLYDTYMHAAPIVENSNM